MMRCRLFWGAIVIVVLAFPVHATKRASEGSFAYDEFETTETCNECHSEIGRQHARSLMAQSFVHEWDEIEYFELALPHALKNEKVAGIKAGCNGCHAPLAYLAEDIPPRRPAERMRAIRSREYDVTRSMVYTLRRSWPVPSKCCCIQGERL